MRNISYLLYYIAHSIPTLLRFNQGTSINGIKRADLETHRVKVPLLDEQDRIASVLEDVATQIELLRDKVEVLKHQKKGLMQRLLTGQVRV